MSDPRLRRIGLLVVLALVAGCKRDGDDTPAAPDTPTVDTLRFRMTDVTAASGIDLVTTSGRAPSTQIVEVKGGGLALIDHDGDGDLDLFVPNGATLDAPDAGPGCRLYENVGDLRFRDVTAAAGLTFHGWGMGVTVGDYDRDGHDDLYVSCFGRNALLRNTGDGRFVDVTDAAGVAAPGWSSGCAFGDLDNDGDLDLYVVGYIDFDVDDPPGPSTFRGQPVFAGPRGLPAQPDVLFENLGDGTFRDVTASSGCAASAASYGLGVLMLDLDGDGRTDVFVGNDSARNFLYRNLGEMQFEDVGVASGIATSGDGASRATMGIGVADVDGDARPDVYTTNFTSEPNTLHLGRPGGFFDDATRRFGLGMTSFPFLGWACAFRDLDHDGAEDLIVFNGHVYPGATADTMVSDYAQPPLLMRRDGPTFERVTADTGGPWLEDAHCDRTATFGDLDDDGDMDVVVAGLNQPVRVLRNDGAPGHWLIVEPMGTPLGCRVEVRRGDAVQRRWIAAGTGYLSSSARYAHVGLGDDDGPVEVLVVWPDGHEQRIDDVAVDQHLRVTR